MGLHILGTGQCQGWMHHHDLWSVPGYNLLHYRPWAIVLPAFVLWSIVRRRAVGWTTIALLTPLLLAEPALFGYDVARWGRTCVELWYPFGTRQAFWQIYDLLPLALVLAATYRPGRNVVRTAAALALLGPLLATAGDRDRPVPLSSPEACRNAARPALRSEDVQVQAVAGMPEHERRLAYLCAMRDYNTRFPGSEPLPGSAEERSDTILLHEGRRACDDERRTAPRSARQPTLQHYVYLCPDVAAVRLQEQKRTRARAAEEYKRERAKVRAFCERQVPEAVVRPVRQYTDVLMGDLMRAYHVGEAAEGTHDGEMPDDLVVSEGGMATVTTGTEDRFCLTVRAYRHEPPPDLDGWERVVEVGFDSPDGKTEITQMGTSAGFPAVTVAGPGRYRLRLHVTGRGRPDPSWGRPAQRHLLVVYPGESEKLEVLK
ncbi:hypothetical protein [Actinomadura sediminis]|uniref:Uncharacterized protein n=1 Tax=Actinomadura sediminis TaxID=1038904 RepID=A0ABW3EMI2_9ACTN